MPNNTSINWTDKSSNLIRARRKDNGKTGHFCTHKNEKCRNCYAEAINMRFGTGLEYKPANREKIEFFFAENEAIGLRKLNARLGKKGELQKVFLSSMTDLFHETMPFELIDKVYALISECPNLIFQTLTKRIDVALKYFYDRHPFDIPENNWFGLTPEDDGSDIPKLFAVQAPVIWLSLEPLLKPIDLTQFFFVCAECGEDPWFGLHNSGEATRWRFDGEKWQHSHGYPIGHLPTVPIQQTDQKFWIVAGGESGPKARATNIDHLHSVVYQAHLAGIPVWVKQLGSIPMMREKEWRARNVARILEHKNHKKILDGFVPLKVTGKGENLNELPEYLQFREMPEI